METYKNPKIKNFKVDLRMRAFEEQNTMAGLQYRQNCFSLQSVQEILAMAIEDIVPNEHYSDSECVLWSAMRSVLNAEKLYMTGKAIADITTPLIGGDIYDK